MFCVHGKSACTAKKLKHCPQREFVFSMTMHELGRPLRPSKPALQDRVEHIWQLVINVMSCFLLWRKPITSKTSLCLFKLGSPSKSLDTTSTRKWVSLGLSPFMAACPACWWDSSSISSLRANIIVSRKHCLHSKHCSTWLT